LRAEEEKVKQPTCREREGDGEGERGWVRRGAREDGWREGGGKYRKEGGDAREKRALTSNRSMVVVKERVLVESSSANMDLRSCAPGIVDLRAIARDFLSWPSFIIVCRLGTATVDATGAAGCVDACCAVFSASVYNSRGVRGV